MQKVSLSLKNRNGKSLSLSKKNLNVIWKCNWGYCIKKI